MTTWHTLTCPKCGATVQTSCPTARAYHRCPKNRSLMTEWVAHRPAAELETVGGAS